MLKQANQLEDAVLKEINKAKKKGLKEGRVDTVSDLEDVLGAVFVSNEKIAKARLKFGKQVGKKCGWLSALPSTMFPGVCAGPPPILTGSPLPLSDIEDCVITATRCEACLKVNAFDALLLDCDQSDDGTVNGSCPVPVPTPSPTPTVTPTPTPTVTGTPLLISIGPLSLTP